MSAARPTAVAGRFYPGSAQALERDLAKYLATGAKPARALGIIVPHAGYMFSGAIAGATYASVQVPKTAIVLCPNHTGMGARRALWLSGSWRIPGDEVPIDEELAERLCESAKLEPDTLAHQFEHSAEVQLPFLRARNREVRIVPICLSNLDARACVQIGEAIAGAIRPAQDDVLLVASTDMSHYVSAEEAKRLDELALERVRALDAEGLCEVVEREDISMCGYVPTAVTIAAARALGVKEARLVRYGNSGETSGDLDQVVGYAGLVIRGAERH